MSKKINVYKNDAKRSYSISDEKRSEYREKSQSSRLAKIAAQSGELESVHEIYTPRLDPNELMPKKRKNGFSCLSLFSGGGGLDLGFDRAGFEHVASYELIPICGDTIRKNRPKWTVNSGPDHGDVTNQDWSQFEGKVDVIHGGPPCQPFSIAGEQKGLDDERNMWGEFIRAVQTIRPKAFVAENVLGLLSPKFSGFVKEQIVDKLLPYHIKMFEMNAANFGVPQMRKRVFFVGFLSDSAFNMFTPPRPTHFHGWSKSASSQSLFGSDLPVTMGVREALGLADIGVDNLAPTLRSGFTGKRNTTSVLNSTAGQKAWGDLEVWPNGVQPTKEDAALYPAANDHYRLSVEDCGLLQGFPNDWVFSGAVYQVLGQIGNSVAPPVAYAVAKEVAKVLKAN